MPKNRSGRSEQWPPKGEIWDYPPKGKLESLNAALSLLEPFQKNPSIDPIEHSKGWVSSTDWIIGTLGRLGRKEAKLRIVETAVAYNNHLAYEQRAPRTKDVLERLRKIQEHALEISDILKNADEYTLHAIHQYLSIRFSDKYLNNDKLPELATTPSGFFVSSIANISSAFEAASQWNDLIAGLALMAQKGSDMYANEWGSKGSGPPDPGGNSNSFVQTYGRAKWQLVNNTWDIFERCRPGEASGTIEGPFHQFVTGIYEFATGHAEERSSLETPVKRVAKLKKRLDEANRELFDLQGGFLDFLDNPRPLTPSEYQKSLALDMEISDLTFELYTGFKPRPFS